MNCVCGHKKEGHWHRAKTIDECGESSCGCKKFFEANIKATWDEKWVDKPDRPGVWVYSLPGDKRERVTAQEITKSALEEAKLWPYRQWMFIGEIPDPPPDPATNAEIARVARELVKRAKKAGFRLTAWGNSALDDKWLELVELVDKK